MSRRTRRFAVIGSGNFVPSILPRSRSFVVTGSFSFCASKILFTEVLSEARPKHLSNPRLGIDVEKKFNY